MRLHYESMRTVGIRTLKNKLSEYLRLVKSGETILVTERDRVIAELAPPGVGRSAMGSDALLAQAIREGKITPPSLKSRAAPSRKPVMPLRKLLDELEEDRKER